MATKKITYAMALKKNKAFASSQLKREAKQGKKGSPSQAQIASAYAKGKDNLTTKDLNAMVDKISPPPKPKKVTKKVKK